MLSSITEWLKLLLTTRCVRCKIRTSWSEYFIWRLAEEKYVERVVGQRTFSSTEVNTFVGDWANSNTQNATSAKTDFPRQVVGSRLFFSLFINRCYTKRDYRIPKKTFFQRETKFSKWTRWFSILRKKPNSWG